MKVEQIYTGCLAQGAYYIISNGEAAIIDPLRETKPYLERLQRDGVKLKYIFETHFHADFVSGHLDLSKATGAPIVYGPTAQPNFEAIIATDLQQFKLGNITLKVLHTPGHTMESSTYLLLDENNKEHAVFTGDTLFIGDVGRPDLAQKATGMTQEMLASHLFHSLRKKIMALPDHVIVYPGHGAGSACGKNMSKETVSTVGEQKHQNYALKVEMSEDQFIKEVTDGLTAPPGYFGMNVAMNKQGYAAIDKVLSDGLKALKVGEVKSIVEQVGAVILDTRDSEVFSKGFIPRSINIGIEGGFAPWVGAIIKDISTKILLVCDKGTENQAIMRLSRVGFDNVKGYLKGGFEVWKKSNQTINSIESISPTNLKEIISPKISLIDVRTKNERNKGCLKTSQNIPLNIIDLNTKKLNKSTDHYIHCAGGYRSMIACSILKRLGFDSLLDISGGFAEIRKAGFKIH